MIRAGTSRRRKCKAFAEVRQYLAEELLRFFEIGDSPTTVVGWKKKRERRDGITGENWSIICCKSQQAQSASLQFR